MAQPQSRGENSQGLHRRKSPQGFSVPPLLALSTTLFLAGLAWAVWELCEKFPWLVLWVAAGGCVALQVFISLLQGGLLAILPSRMAKLQRPPFELLCESAAFVASHGCNLARLTLLAFGDLDEAQCRRILEEVPAEVQHQVFDLPSVSLLPWWLQCLLVGPAASAASEGSGAARDPGACRPLGHQATLTPQTTRTVEDLLEVLKKVEESTQAVRHESDSDLTKVLEEKAADAAVALNTIFLKRGTVVCVQAVTSTSLSILQVLVQTAVLPWRLTWLVMAFPFKVAFSLCQGDGHTSTKVDVGKSMRIGSHRLAQWASTVTAQMAASLASSEELDGAGPTTPTRELEQEDEDHEEVDGPEDKALLDLSPAATTASSPDVRERRRAPAS